MKIAYLDCFSGISGDMLLGALMDVGASMDMLVEELKKIPVEGYSFHTRKEKRGAIAGTRVLIDLGPQPHRSFRDIQRLIGSSALKAPVREKSMAIFERLAWAESQVHGMPVSQVHFHEVGALDSILDIVGSVIALDYLGLDRICGSRVPLGGGFVKTQHGSLPVPAPATVLLLSGVPVYDNGVRRELVTPTGAAILTTLADSFGLVPDMTLLSVGYGVGSHSASEPPNLLRILIGMSRPALLVRELLLLETNIDDMNPEFYDFLFDRLFSLGVLDVNLMSIQMKKNRPGTLLRILIEPSLQSSVLEVLFAETTTLGIRIHELRRVELPRKLETIATPYGPCLVKRIFLPDGEFRVVPEYEECKRIAQSQRAPLQRIYEEIAWLARKHFQEISSPLAVGSE